MSERQTGCTCAMTEETMRRCPIHGEDQHHDCFGSWPCPVHGEAESVLGRIRDMSNDEFWDWYFGGTTGIEEKHV